MSWSVSFIGKPDNVVKALEDYSTKVSGVSKEEYDAALPHISAIVKQNFNKREEYTPMIKVDASGSGHHTPDGVQQLGCSVNVQQFYGQLV